MATFEVFQCDVWHDHCAATKHFFEKQNINSQAAAFGMIPFNLKRYFRFLFATWVLYFPIFSQAFIPSQPKHTFIKKNQPSVVAESLLKEVHAGSSVGIFEASRSNSFAKWPHYMQRHPSHLFTLFFEHFQLSKPKFTDSVLVYANKPSHLFRGSKRAKKKTSSPTSASSTQKDTKFKKLVGKEDGKTSLEKLLRGETGISPIPGMEKLIGAIDAELGSVSKDEIDAIPFVKWKRKLQSTPLKGYHLPYGLVPQWKWELLKLFGRLGDPHWPLRADSISSNLLLDRLFRGNETIDENTFKSLIEWKWNFLMPSSGVCFEEINEICWQSWTFVRNLQERSLENSYRKKSMDEDSNFIDLPTVIRRVNKEINQQGIHPAVMNAFWIFLAGDSQAELSRNQMAIKLFEKSKESRKSVYILSPDEFANYFSNSIKTALSTFNETSYKIYHEDVLSERKYIQKCIQENAELRRRNKEFSFLSREKIQNALLLNEISQ